MRPSSPALSDAFARGAASQGADVVKIGLASTDQLYFASGHLNLPGAMFTASHNPAKYNGIKMCRAGAAPVGQDTGLSEIRELAARELAEPGSVFTPAERQGTVTEQDLLTAYAAHLRSLVDLTEIRPLKVVVDAGNGMGGHTVPTVFHGLPIDLVPMYFELDGSFPNHEANPLDPKNLVDLQKKVVETGADIGLAFDGDADRCFVVDERGEPVSPSSVTALVAVRELAKHPGATIIHNLITSHAVPEIVREHGGVPVRTRVGHSFIKQEMAEHRRGLRRRALRALLLRGLLEGRHRHAGRDARAGRARRAAAAAVRADRRVRPLRRVRRDQLRGGRPGRPHRRGARRLRRPARGRDRRPGRHDRGAARRGLVVQPAPVQHRAAAAPEHRGAQHRRGRRLRDEVLAIVRA